MDEHRGVTFRGTQEGVLLKIDGSLDYEAIERQLKEHMESAEGFFQGADLTVEVVEGSLSGEEIAQLDQLVGQRCGASISGVKVTRGGDVSSLDWPGSGFEVAEIPPRRKGVSSRRVSALMVTGTVRSGQRIHHGGHLVLLGDVNPAGEIIAAGDIVVMGRLRGVAHAGASGEKDSIIAAASMEPAQLRISSYIRRAPDGAAPSTGSPEVARVRGEHIVVETYTDYLEKVALSGMDITAVSPALDGRY